MRGLAKNDDRRAAPDHEHYFEELCDIFSQGGVVDPQAVEQLRDRYDINQITPLRYGPPVYSEA